MNQPCASFDSSVGRAVDCSGEVIHRSLVQIRLEGVPFFFLLASFYIWSIEASVHAVAL